MIHRDCLVLGQTEIHSFECNQCCYHLIWWWGWDLNPCGQSPMEPILIARWDGSTQPCRSARPDGTQNLHHPCDFQAHSLIYGVIEYQRWKIVMASSFFSSQDSLQHHVTPREQLFPGTRILELKCHYTVATENSNFRASLTVTYA